MSRPTGEYRIHSLNSRSDLLALEHHHDAFRQSWPSFFRGSSTLSLYFPRLIDYTGLLRYQYVMVWQDRSGQETVVAHARAVPFYWPDLDEFRRRHARGTSNTNPNTSSLAGENGGIHVLETLPDGGLETILSRGVEQFFRRQGLPSLMTPLTADQARDWPVRKRAEMPNALAAIGVVVDEGWRGQGIVHRMVEYMKSVAGRDGLGAVVLPLRPSGKEFFPTVEMGRYLGWRRETGPQDGGATTTTTAATASGSISVMSTTFLTGVDGTGGVSFDPLLRKHLAMGGRVAKVARSSVYVHHNIKSWEEWMKVDLQELVGQAEDDEDELEGVADRGFVDVRIPGALMPVRYFPRAKRLEYTEPNVWVFHEVTRSGLYSTLGM